MKVLHSTFKLILIITLLISAINFVAPHTTSALSGTDFDPGRIIDDYVFYNKSALTAAQIQLFLNSKVPVCDTWGTQPYAGTTRANYAASRGVSTPFICLKEYSQDVSAVTNSGSDLCGGSISAGTKSAAQIIYEVSQACGINPQVLLVLLQKEQALVTDDWPWPIQYSAATGYGCPDSALSPSVDANHNGCYDAYEGFFNQVYQAAQGYKRYRANATDYNYVANRNNTILWNPNAACGSSQVWIQNQATAGLYIYTPYRPNPAALSNLYGPGDDCSSYGNRNFWRMFSDWFGTTKATPVNCDSKVANVACVWSVIKSDGSQFLTSSNSERDNAIHNYNWIYDGIAFYASQTQKTGTIPVYRLRNAGRHYYTVDQTERSNLLGTSGWVDEGIPFYVYPTTLSSSMSHKVYKLHNASNDEYYWTTSEEQKQFLINSGYTLGTTTFYGFSGMADLPMLSANRDNVYRLQGTNTYLYTSNLHELESVIGSGYSYEGVLTTAPHDGSGTPVYRLRSAGGYFYTTNTAERSRAVTTYGMADEGVGFTLDNTSDRIFRLANAVSGKYLYTASISEVLSVTNTNGWSYEGLLFSKDLNPSPIYRFINVYNHRHFYTIDINEATKITNKGWHYETVAFSANPSSGLPVYRLLLKDKHFYTANANERDAAVNNFGYVYEGIAFYVSQTLTSKPVYRLQGGNNEYFYTASSQEKDTAVSKYGYYYEGIAFYLP